MEDDEEDILNM